jgi:transcriptional regulator with XRE-family HTH domain
MGETTQDTAGPGSPSRDRPRRQNGPVIRTLREKDGWKSQQAFADAVGLSQAALSNIERERRQTRVSTLNRIARALGVSVSVIMRDSCDADEKGDAA